MIKTVNELLVERLIFRIEQGRYRDHTEEIIMEDWWRRRRMIERSNTVFKIK